MNIGYIPKLSMADSVSNPFKAAGPMPKLEMDADVKKPSFQDALMSTLDHVNQVSQTPDALMHDAMTTGGVDVHDVMVANAKAELLVSITTQVATKVVQAYDKILQIQI
jgi:flagellar hook-basal body complex protein FliE